MIKDLSKDFLYRALAVHQEVWHEAYVSMTNEPFIYPSHELLNRRMVEGDPTSDERKTMLFHFQEEGAINILQKYDYERYTPEKWLIEIINPNFSELVELIKETLNAKKSTGNTWYIPSEENDNSYIAPDKRDYWYEDKQLRFKLANGGVDQFDFSKAGVARKLIETFLDLWKSNNSGDYSQIKVKEKYKELFGTDLDEIGSTKANIMASIINPKSLIKDRIEWGFDRKNKVWIFKILPLSR